MTHVTEDRTPQRIFVFLADARSFGGLCPACESNPNHTGCVVGNHAFTNPEGRQPGDVVQVFEVLCAGTPTGPVRSCPGCAEEVP